MYVGVYKRVDDDGDEPSGVSFQSTQLDHTNKMAIASHKVKKDCYLYMCALDNSLACLWNRGLL